MEKGCGGERGGTDGRRRMVLDGLEWDGGDECGLEIWSGNG